MKHRCHISAISVMEFLCFPYGCSLVSVVLFPRVFGKPVKLEIYFQNQSFAKRRRGSTKMSDYEQVLHIISKSMYLPNIRTDRSRRQILLTKNSFISLKGLSPILNKPSKLAAHYQLSLCCNNILLLRD